MASTKQRDSREQKKEDRYFDKQIALIKGMNEALKGNQTDKHSGRMQSCEVRFNTLKMVEDEAYWKDFYKRFASEISYQFEDPKTSKIDTRRCTISCGLLLKYGQLDYVKRFFEVHDVDLDPNSNSEKQNDWVLFVNMLKQELENFPELQDRLLAESDLCNLIMKVMDRVRVFALQKYDNNPPQTTQTEQSTGTQSQQNLTPNKSTTPQRMDSTLGKRKLRSNKQLSYGDQQLSDQSSSQSFESGVDNKKSPITLKQATKSQPILKKPAQLQTHRKFTEDIEEELFTIQDKEQGEETDPRSLMSQISQYEDELSQSSIRSEMSEICKYLSEASDGLSQSLKSSRSNADDKKAKRSARIYRHVIVNRNIFLLKNIFKGEITLLPQDEKIKLSFAVCGEDIYDLKRSQATVLFAFKSQLLTLHDSKPEMVNFQMFPEYSPVQQQAHYGHKSCKFDASYKLYGKDCATVVDMPYRICDYKVTEARIDTTKIFLACGADLRFKKKIIPEDSPNTRPWGFNLLDRHMLLVNNLCNYPVYNEMRFFMAMYAIASGQEISEVFRNYSNQSASCEFLGALVQSSQLLPSRLVLREKAKVDDKIRNCIPSLQDLILSHQTQSQLGVLTYVLELKFDHTIPSLFTIDNYIDHMIVKPAGEGPIVILKLDGEDDSDQKNKPQAHLKDFVSQLFRHKFNQDFLSKLSEYKLYEVCPIMTNGLDARHHLIKGLLFSFSSILAQPFHLFETFKNELCKLSHPWHSNFIVEKLNHQHISKAKPEIYQLLSTFTKGVNDKTRNDQLNQDIIATQNALDTSIMSIEQFQKMQTESTSDTVKSFLKQLMMREVYYKMVSTKRLEELNKAQNASSQRTSTADNASQALAQQNQCSQFIGLVILKTNLTEIEVSALESKAKEELEQTQNVKIDVTKPAGSKLVRLKLQEKYFESFSMLRKLLSIPYYCCGTFIEDPTPEQLQNFNEVYKIIFNIFALRRSQDVYGRGQDDSYFSEQKFMIQLSPFKELIQSKSLPIMDMLTTTLQLDLDKVPSATDVDGLKKNYLAFIKRIPEKTKQVKKVLMDQVSKQIKTDATLVHQLYQNTNLLQSKAKKSNDNSRQAKVQYQNEMASVVRQTFQKTGDVGPASPISTLEEIEGNELVGSEYHYNPQLMEMFGKHFIAAIAEVHGIPKGINEQMIQLDRLKQQYKEVKRRVNCNIILVSFNHGQCSCPICQDCLAFYSLKFRINQLEQVITAAKEGPQSLFQNLKKIIVKNGSKGFLKQLYKESKKQLVENESKPQEQQKKKRHRKNRNAKVDSNVVSDSGDILQSDEMIDEVPKSLLDNPIQGKEGSSSTNLSGKKAQKGKGSKKVSAMNQPPLLPLPPQQQMQQYGYPQYQQYQMFQQQPLQNPIAIGQGYYPYAANYVGSGVPMIQGNNGYLANAQQPSQMVLQPQPYEQQPLGGGINLEHYLHHFVGNQGLQVQAQVNQQPQAIIPDNPIGASNVQVQVNQDGSGNQGVSGVPGGASNAGVPANPAAANNGGVPSKQV